MIRSKSAVFMRPIIERSPSAVNGFERMRPKAGGAEASSRRRDLSTPQFFRPSGIDKREAVPIRFRSWAKTGKSISGAALGRPSRAVVFPNRDQGPHRNIEADFRPRPCPIRGRRPCRRRAQGMAIQDFPQPLADILAESPDGHFHPQQLC